MAKCKHGTDTGLHWGNCKCAQIECRCAGRIEQLENRVIRSEVDFHTKLIDFEGDEPPENWEPYSCGYVLVRSKWCSREKCEWFDAEGE